MSAKSVVAAEREMPVFSAGDQVRVDLRFPIGHFRVPNDIRGKRGVVEAVIEPEPSTTKTRAWPQRGPAASLLPGLDSHG